MADQLRLKSLMMHHCLGLSFHTSSFAPESPCPLSVIHWPLAPCLAFKRRRRNLTTAACLWIRSPDRGDTVRQSDDGEEHAQNKLDLPGLLICRLRRSCGAWNLFWTGVAIDRSPFWSSKKSTSATKSQLTLMIASTLLGD